MRPLMLEDHSVVPRLMLGCAALGACLTAQAARQYDLTAGGTVQLAAPTYLVDFSTSGGPVQGSFDGLYSLGGTRGNGAQEGYNAAGGSGVPLMPSIGPGPGAARDVTLGELGQVVGGAGQMSAAVSMVVFALSLSEPGMVMVPGQVDPKEQFSRSGISLDAFQVYVADAPVADASSLGSLTSQARLVYDLDFDYSSGQSQDRSLLLADGVSSADADLYVKVPTGAFESAGASQNSYVYVYSKFGLQNGFEADQGYEQWSFLRGGVRPPVIIVPGPAVVPEASTWFAGLAMAGLVGGALWMRRNARTA